MASAAAAIESAVSEKTVDKSLWWDPFARLFELLDATSLSSDLSPYLLDKVIANHGWFLDSVAGFKPPNEASKLALDFPKIIVGSHQLDIKPELKEVALQASTLLCLDEVQCYILVNRSPILCKSLNIDGEESMNLVSLEYYVERQCLLKCIRRIFLHALHIVNEPHITGEIRDEALLLLHDGLEGKLLSILEALFSSLSSDKMGIELSVLWFEETLIEVNLVLDTIFLVYYENFCCCSFEQWHSLCSIFKDILSGHFDIGKLAVSTAAQNSFLLCKAQILMILIETLDLEYLLRMVHDEVPFSQGDTTFTLSNIQEIDALLSSFSSLGAVEAGPLILAWAVYLCLILSLPNGKNYDFLTELDHVNYVQQAFVAAPFSYLLEFLRSDTLRDSDGPVSGFLSVLRTFISAFIASYELTPQLEGNTLELIVHILCEIYRGEGTLSMQFWDSKSIVDGPIRSLLYLLESEFPFHTVELLRLLSALCEGSWSAECVHNFLEKMIGITALYEIPDHLSGLKINDVVDTYHQLHIPGFEGVIIPAGSQGYILKIYNNSSALVRWKCMHSGLKLLLSRLAEGFHSKNYEESLLIVSLLHRLMTFNMALRFSLMNIKMSLPEEATNGVVLSDMGIDVVKIICSLLVNLIQEAGNSCLISICIRILTAMMKCAPSHVVKLALRANIFGTEDGDLSSNAWLLSGGFARMLLAEVEEDGEVFSLVTAVLEFTMQLVEIGAQNSIATALVIFSIQYVFVDHVNWKYKSNYARWKVTLKVLEVMKTCSRRIHFLGNIGCTIFEIVVSDSSVQNTLGRLLSTLSNLLGSYFIMQYELKEVENLKLSVCVILEIVYFFLNLPKETFASRSAFVQCFLSSTIGPVPVTAAVVSLISLSSDFHVQVAAARVLSSLCIVASKFQHQSAENFGLFTNTVQIENLSRDLYNILRVDANENEDVQISVVHLLISFANYQPSFLLPILSPEDQTSKHQSSSGNMKSKDVASAASAMHIGRESIIDTILKHIELSVAQFDRSPSLLLNILILLKALWEKSFQYIGILERIRSSKMFWKHLGLIVETNTEKGLPDGSMEKVDTDHIEAFRHKCCALVLEIMAHELFLQEHLLLDNEPGQPVSDNLTGNTCSKLEPERTKPSYVGDILSTWFKRPIMENLIYVFTSCGFDSKIILHAKMTVCLCAVHLITKVCNGNSGSLSLSTTEMMTSIWHKLIKHPAFSALTVQYSLHGYGTVEVSNLILNDLYYHMQGELEGREIGTGPFKELSHFLLDMEIFRANYNPFEKDIISSDRSAFVYDIPHVQSALQIELWDYSDWMVSKGIAEKMFLHMHEMNMIFSFLESKYFALKSLLGIISMYTGNSTGKIAASSEEIPHAMIETSVKCVCKHLRETEGALIPASTSFHISLNFHVAQAELLLVLSRILFEQYMGKSDKQLCIPLSLSLIKVCGSNVRSLTERMLSTIAFDKVVKVLLAILLRSFNFSYKVFFQNESKFSSEASVACLELLPWLCKYSANMQFCDLSVSLLDSIMKCILTPNAWLPILQKHLHVQLLVQRLHSNDVPVSRPVILKFFLTLARTKGGACLLYYANVFSLLKVLFNYWKDGHFSCCFLGSSSSAISIRDGPLCCLGLAIISAMICSLGDDCRNDIVDGSILHFFSEKPCATSIFISLLLSAVEDHFKDRFETSKIEKLLMVLRNTELTLTLVCLLARHQSSWSRLMKEMDSELRESSIHLLSFISKGIHCSGDPLIRFSPFVCPPMLTDEPFLDKRTCFVNSKHGWFGSFKTKAHTLGTEKQLGMREGTNGNINDFYRAGFSDLVAIQIYRIALFLLQFLCIQAVAASKSAVEMEFVDLSHFPELPTPEILHGLQDQTIAIVSEVCTADELESTSSKVCLLLLQVLEKSLYLELCLSQSCGIRPAPGRVEDFSEGIRQLVIAVEKHPKLKDSVSSLKQIMELAYPALRHAYVI